MTIKAISNVSYLDYDTVTGPGQVIFTASPGAILSVEMNMDKGKGGGYLPETVIEGSGCTLLPAFFDANINSAAADRDLQLFATFGIATVLDMSSTTPEIQAMRMTSTSNLGLPSYLAAGTVATGFKDSENHLYPLREMGFVKLASDAEAFVVARITGPGQADYIKVLVDLPGLDDSILLALVQSTHRHGKLAIAHATQIGSFTRALDAGFDIITPVPLDGIIDDETVRRMAHHGIACVPTLCMRRKTATYFQDRVRDTAHGSATYAAYDYQNAMANVKKLHAAGVPICAGSDCNRSPHVPVLVGESLHDEIEQLVEAGLSTIEGLRAATTVPAKVFKLGDRGALQQGMRADMILLEGNPVEDITATRRIRKVWLKGIEVDA